MKTQFDFTDASKINLLVRKKGNKETGGTSAKHISYVNGFNSWMSERAGLKSKQAKEGILPAFISCLLLLVLFA